ncbi:MAG: CPBP family intramembrane metalloprotease [Calditrichaeota bacterium]|nr:MAG: CPBP family intramembrane metalloprotease [Calditrichota bacterium]
MKIKPHQQLPLRKDLQLSIILLVILTFSFGMYLIRTPLSVPLMLLTTIVFVLIVSPLLLLANPTLIKVLRTAQNGRQIVSGLAVLQVIFYLLYCIAVNRWSFPQAGWLLLALCFVLFIILRVRRDNISTPLDLALLLLLWIPLEFGLYKPIALPPIQELINPIAFLILYWLVVVFFLYRQYDVGLSFRLRGDDLRTLVLYFVLLFLLVVIIGSLFRFIAISDRIPALSDVLIRFVFIFFLIAIPEELLFRGIVYKLFAQLFKGQPWAIGRAMIASSLLFGLSHALAPVSPFVTNSLSSWGHLGLPWIHIVTASVAGFFYCLVFVKTQKIMAAAGIHLLLDWAWYVFFSG